MHKRLFLFLIISTIACYLSPIAYGAETLDKVIVIVNSETITQSELDIASEAVKSEASRKEILDRMIEQKLILSEAKKLNVEVNNSEIEERLKDIKSKFNPGEGFTEALKESGVSLDELKQKYADQIMVDKLLEMEVRKKIVVTPSEVSAYYDAHREEFKEPEQIRLKNILIKPEGDLNDNDAQILAEKLLGFLKAGENFDELALKYSKGPSADRGGDLGLIKRGQMLKKIEDVVFTLDAGQVSEVIKTPLGYHIFRVEEKHPQRIRELNGAKSEVEKKLFLEKLKTRYTEWIEGLKKNAYISFR